MAIRFVKERSFWWPVTVAMPGDDKKVEKFEFKIRIKDASSTDYLDAYLSGTKPVCEYLSSLIVDWEGVLDESGAPIPCTEESKAQIIPINYMMTALNKALEQIVAGEPEVKNSKPSPATL